MLPVIVRLECSCEGMSHAKNAQASCIMQVTKEKFKGELHPKTKFVLFERTLKITE